MSDQTNVRLSVVGLLRNSGSDLTIGLAWNETAAVLPEAPGAAPYVHGKLGKLTAENGIK
jgi:hypothetical protein